MIDYAKVSHMEKWLRHPAMGDPSFDTFEKVGPTVHVSHYPYEWAVNGSLFVDDDDTWYLYAGLYAYGYLGRDGTSSHFEIYRSKDQGRSWECLGPGLEKRFMFDGAEAPSSSCPDAVLYYDPKMKKYLLTYDWSTDNGSWEVAHHYAGSHADAGAALAWADSPAGPFTRFKTPVFRNTRLQGHFGRFDRFYATTVIPRKNDYLALILCDSGPNFAWGLAAAASPAADQEFDMPSMVLCADKTDYYPTPMEFYPAFVVDDTVYAPATSVAANRNYQFLFAAKLEEAHNKDAWHMVRDGSLWHSRGNKDEYYGIWGQTINGCVDKTGQFRVMYASKNERNCGTLSVATRPWDKPLSDGFTFSGHAAPSLTVTRDAYRDFTLRADFTLTGGFADFLFGFDGKIGANAPVSDCAPCPESLTGYTALRVAADTWSLVDHDRLVCHGRVSSPISSIRIKKQNGRLAACAGEETLFDMDFPQGDFAPLGIRTDKFTVLDVTRFEADGEYKPSILRFNAPDALLGGGVGDCNFRVENGLRVGTSRVKWNIYCASFDLAGVTGPAFGKALVRVDGREVGTADFSIADAAQATVFRLDGLSYGPHGIELIPQGDPIPVPELVAQAE